MNTQPHIIMRTIYRAVVAFIAGVWSSMFGQAQPTTVPVAEGMPAAAIAARSMHLTAKGPHQRTGWASYTKSHIDRKKRDIRNRIASASRARNRGT